MPPDRMPSFATSPPELVTRFDEVMTRIPVAQRRSMFGYPCAFANEQMFTGLFAADWMVRLPDDARDELFAAGGRPFEPMPGRPMKEYATFPASLIEEPAALTPWLERSLAYVLSLPPKAPKKPRRASKA